VITFRVKAKSEELGWRRVTVDDAGQARCDCVGFDGAICSHIDATLIAGERGMVHGDDLALADSAQSAASVIAVPSTWKGTWRREYWWRGISRRRPSINPRTSGKPLVCFTGTGPSKDRKTWLAEARAGGWDTTDEPSPFTTVLVVADRSAMTAKMGLARKNKTAIVDYGEWVVLLADGEVPD
jgi:hypothetical protein